VVFLPGIKLNLWLFNQFNIRHSLPFKNRARGALSAVFFGIRYLGMVFGMVWYGMVWYGIARSAAGNIRLVTKKLNRAKSNKKLW